MASDLAFTQKRIGGLSLHQNNTSAVYWIDTIGDFPVNQFQRLATLSSSEELAHRMHVCYAPDIKTVKACLNLLLDQWSEYSYPEKCKYCFPDSKSDEEYHDTSSHLSKCRVGSQPKCQLCSVTDNLDIWGLKGSVVGAGNPRCEINEQGQKKYTKSTFAKPVLIVVDNVHTVLRTISGEVGLDERINIYRSFGLFLRRTAINLNVRILCTNYMQKEMIKTSPHNTLKISLNSLNEIKRHDSMDGNVLFSGKVQPALGKNWETLLDRRIIFADEDTIGTIACTSNTLSVRPSEFLFRGNQGTSKRLVKVCKDDFGPTSDWLPFEVEEGKPFFPPQILIYPLDHVKQINSINKNPSE